MLKDSAALGEASGRNLTITTSTAQNSEGLVGQGLAQVLELILVDFAAQNSADIREVAAHGCKVAAAGMALIDSEVAAIAFANAVEDLLNGLAWSGHIDPIIADFILHISNTSGIARSLSSANFQ